MIYRELRTCIVSDQYNHLIVNIRMLVLSLYFLEESSCETVDVWLCAKVRQAVHFFTLSAPISRHCRQPRCQNLMLQRTRPSVVWTGSYTISLTMVRRPLAVPLKGVHPVEMALEISDHALVSCIVDLRLIRLWVHLWLEYGCFHDRSRHALFTRIDRRVILPCNRSECPCYYRLSA